MSKFVYQNEIGEFADNYVHTTVKKALADYVFNTDAYFDGTGNAALLVLDNGDKHPMDMISTEVKRMNYITFRDDDGESVLTVRRLEVK